MADSHSDARQWCFTAGGPVLRPGEGLRLALGPQRAPVCWGSHGLEVLGRGSPGVMVRLHRTGASDDVLRAGEGLAVEVDGRGFMAGPAGTGEDRCAVSFGPDPAAIWAVRGVPHGSALPAGARLALVDRRSGACLVAHDGCLVWSSPGPGLRSPERSGAVPGDDGDLSLVTVVGRGRLDQGRAGVWRDVAHGGPVDVPGPVPPGVPAGASWWIVGRAGPVVPPERSPEIGEWLAIAWAESAGAVVRTGPTGSGWPARTMSWRMVRPVGGDGPVVLRLPLPADDGAPGTSTTWRVDLVEEGAPRPLVTVGRTERGRRDLRVAFPAGRRGGAVECRIDVMVHRRA